MILGLNQCTIEHNGSKRKIEDIFYAIEEDQASTLERYFFEPQILNQQGLYKYNDDDKEWKNCFIFEQISPSLYKVLDMETNNIHVRSFSSINFLEKKLKDQSKEFLLIHLTSMDDLNSHLTTNTYDIVAAIDGSCFKGRGTGYMVWKGKAEGEEQFNWSTYMLKGGKTYKKFKKNSAQMMEVRALMDLLKNLDVNNMTEKKKLLIISDSIYVCASLARIKKWSENNFILNNGKEAIHKFEWQSIWQLISNSQLQITIAKASSHTGIIPNEVVDEIARKYAAGEFIENKSETETANTQVTVSKEDE